MFEFIQQNPEEIVAAFAVVNALWIVFVYVNSQRHDREMESLRHSLNLEAERRKKVFELKVSQYESYVSGLDAFAKKHQVDLPAKMQPLVESFFSEYLSADGDKEKEKTALMSFSRGISEMTREIHADYLVLQAESNRLKLTATKDMLSVFCALEAAMEETLEKANEIMRQMTDLMLRQDHETMARLQSSAMESGTKVKTEAQRLMQLMRNELQYI